MTERTVSDIILDLERKLETVLQVVHVQDMNIKLMLDRLNGLYQRTATSETLPKSVEKENTSNSTPTVAAEFTGVRRTVRPETFDVSNADSEKTVAVFQKIQTKNNLPVTFADISIFDDKNDLKKKCRTTSTGTWHCALPPGKYWVRISKRSGMTKQRVEQRFDFTVDHSDQPTEIDTITFDA